MSSDEAGLLKAFDLIASGSMRAAANVYERGRKKARTPDDETFNLQARFRRCTSSAGRKP